MTAHDQSQKASKRAASPEADAARVTLLKLSKPRRQWYFVRRQLLRDKAAMTGGIVLIIILSLTILAPFFAPFDPIAQSDDPADRLAPPSALHPMGTDDLRRDILSRVLYGGQTTLRVGVISVSGAVAVGLVLGLISGYFGGRMDDLISRFLDTLMTLPGILLAIVIIAILGTGLNNAMLAVAISNMPTIARLVRGDTMVEKNKIYIEASRSMGASQRRPVGHRDCHPARRQRHPDRCRFEFPGAGRAAAASGMGVNAQRWARLHALRAVVDDLVPWTGYFHHRDCHQSVGRRSS
jgi:peptide/nickel transport system permease protein